MKVGFITIGQSPRVDVVPEIKPYLGDAEIIECGALDGLTLEEIKELAPKEGDYVLVSRLRDGTQVRLSREKIVKRLQECIKKLEEEVDVIGFLCTGEFPELTSRKLLVEPSLLLLKTVSALGVSNLGVIVPDPDQVEMTRRKWEGIAENLKVQSVSPYIGKKEDFIKAAQELKECDLIVMDCIGYTLSSKKIVKEITKKPVVLPRTLMARVIGELLEG
ncbi:AroM family protein [Thermococcus aggregans]|uniref:AroM family protein n=1 Tax=Thermococcus aggregans TaxID=110163 RepID=A0A9E7SNW2_THEAG|nr:AroM family protein [Thermococcus aggregans]USS40736.1 AroM family protein [Thermococcus aggregans]